MEAAGAASGEAGVAGSDRVGEEDHGSEMREMGRSRTR
jgi:hypothetical protein